MTSLSFAKPLLGRSLAASTRLLLLLTTLAGCGIAPTSNEPELNTGTNLKLILSRLEPGSANPTQVNLIRTMVIQSSPQFTERCQRFMDDLYEAYWGFPKDGEQGDRAAFESKWRGIYDLNYGWFGHAFEEGNCGWAVKSIESLEYLGADNNGDWYQLNIVGGCSERDSNNRLSRTIKLTKADSGWLIDAIYDYPSNK